LIKIGFSEAGARPKETGRLQGNIANSQQCEDGLPSYELKTVSSGGQEVVAEADGQGGLWLLFGTDPGLRA